MYPRSRFEGPRYPAPSVRMPMPYRGPIYHRNFHNYPINRQPTAFPDMNTHYPHSLPIHHSTYFTTSSLPFIAASSRGPPPSPQIPVSCTSRLSTFASTNANISLPAQSTTNAPPFLSSLPLTTSSNLSIDPQLSTSTISKNALSSDSSTPPQSTATFSTAPSLLSSLPSTTSTDLSIPSHSSIATNSHNAPSSDNSIPTLNCIQTFSTVPSSSCSDLTQKSPKLHQRLRSSSANAKKKKPLKKLDSILVVSSDSNEEEQEEPVYQYGQNTRQNKRSRSINTKEKKSWREEPILPAAPKPSTLLKKVPRLMSTIRNRSFDRERVIFHTSSLDEKMVDKILANVTDAGSVHWSAVVGLSHVKQRLKEMVVYPLLNPALFKGKCLATEARATFFSVTASTFGSKWYGETDTLARTLFECARALQPSIIFIDEVDSVLSSPRESDGGCSTRLRTELLACMTRKEQFKHALLNEKHNITEVEMSMLANKTKGYSGADITQISRNAALKTLRSLDPNGLSIEFVTIDDVRPMNVNDFLESIDEIPRSVSKEMISQLEKFNKQFGTL